MSRWWPEALEIRIAAPGAGGQAAGQRVQQALDGFEARLDALQPPPRTPLHGIVASGLVRHAIVPWNPALARRRQRLRFAEHCLHETFGEPVQGWCVSIDEARHGQPALACAVDEALVDGLQAAAARRGLRLASLQPALMHACNRQRQRLSADRFWCLLNEADAATLLLVQDGAPGHVLVTAPALAAAAIRRESFALGLDPVPPVVALEAAA